MTGIIFATLLIVLAWRMGAAFDERRTRRLEIGHYVWPGSWVVDGIITDALPPARADKHPLPRLEEVGEGAE